MVYISPYLRFSLKDCFFNCTFVSLRAWTVKQLDDHPIEGHIFNLHLTRDPSLMKSDGFLDFYAARQKIASIIKNAIGEFCDYNGGAIIKQHALLQSFKDMFNELAQNDLEIIETFFYAIMPLEKPSILSLTTLSILYANFLENRKQTLSEGSTYAFKVHCHNNQTFLFVYGENLSLTKEISIFLKEKSYKDDNIVYNIIETANCVHFNCAFICEDTNYIETFIQTLKELLHQWHQKETKKPILRIGLEYSLVSLDPRIGGEGVSDEVLKLLFEGLTRYSSSGSIENAVAETINISQDKKEYIFKLRKTSWNDGSPVTAFDFEYAWKKVLAPNANTSFAYIFYPIKNAKEAKDGLVSTEEIGIKALDDYTLKVNLVRATPYFLQLTTRPLYAPIHRRMDRQFPQWPYQCQKNYPCNGPYQINSRQNQRYQLIKNPFYWKTQHVYYDQINLVQVNCGNAFQAFQKKEIDWVGNPFGSYHSSYKPSAESRIITTTTGNMVSWLVFNTRLPLFNHRKLRQAFAYSIQRAKIITDAFLPLTAAYSPIPNEMQKNPSQALFPDYDQVKALQLFREALDELGLSLNDFPPLSFVYLKNGIREHTALCIQKQLKESLGIECTLHPLSWDTLFNQLVKGDFQMGLIYWTSWIDDPIYTLNAFRFSSEEINYPKWEHSEYQKFLDLAEDEVDFDKRTNYFYEAEKVLCQEMPVIPLYSQTQQALIQKEISILSHQVSGYSFDLIKGF